MSDAAWRENLEHHGPYALGLARQALRQGGMDGSLAEDVVQEVWAALLADGGRRLRAIDPARGSRPYLSAAVLNAARTRLREGGRRAARERDHAARPASPDAPEEPLIRAETAEGLERALALLDPEERLLLRWIYWDSATYAEAAALMGVEASSVGPLLTRARERLRLALAGNPEIPVRGRTASP